MAFTTVATGNVIEAEHVKELQGALDGTAGRGQSIAFTQLSDASGYAVDVKNQDSTNSYGLRVKDSSDNVIITAAKAVLTIGKKIAATGLGTFTAAANMFDLAATWNAGSDTFNGIKVNITNTASAAASCLLDLQKASTSLLKVAISGAITSALGTVTTAIDQLTLTATWNEGTTLFRGIKVNVTNTASAATSRLLDLQVGGTSVFAVNTSGVLVAGGQPTGAFQARLTLETGVAVSTTDQTAATTLYLTPYKGETIEIYDGTAWLPYSLNADISLDISAYTASTPYDIWVYNNSGTLTLDSTAWTNDTTRATALATQDGVLCKTGALTRRYAGTIRITGTTGQCEDSASRRFVWNYYNRVAKDLLARDGTNSWTYTTATWRASNNNTTDGTGRVAIIIGVAEDYVDARAITTVGSDQGASMGVGIALDATNTNHAQVTAAAPITNDTGIGVALYRAYVAIGYHFLQRTEISGTAAGTTTWYGDNNSPTTVFSGLQATVMG